MKRTLVLGLLFPFALAFAAGARAKNVILFIGDAGGVSTLNAASLHGYDAPQKLFIQQMPHMALVDTSSADAWVTDSAAGMTAIITGQKTNNSVLSQAADAVPGKKDGERLKTLLEYAEQHGLSTGVITNVSVADATPAACYAHVNRRNKTADIMEQMFAPRYGDGVDLVIGSGHKAIWAAAAERGIDIDKLASEKGYTSYTDPTAIPDKRHRVIAIVDQHFDIQPVVDRAIDILSKNSKGFFLMVEWDLHTDHIKEGLDHAVELDNTIRQTATRMKKDTLILFSADHSFDIRLRGGKKGQPLVVPVAVQANGGGNGSPAPKPAIRMENGHTGEEIVAAAQGPGAERLHGFVPNTELFRIMISAYGWDQPQRGGR